MCSTFELGSADKILRMGLHPFPCTEYQVLILNKQRQAVGARTLTEKLLIESHQKRRIVGI